MKVKVTLEDVTDYDEYMKALRFLLQNMMFEFPIRWKVIDHCGELDQII